ncbi:MAG: hypothetical protein RMI34_12015 [Chloroherpetonaceae bacterium]|nr:hypothetical protein [Chloroherpetonaceae bacterium]MCS7210014.1 hypothetical protein [Chloroherpetonaceae bacterium]MDW8020782.1 hypothetical protein [Chloroherpetonaceae bacterium]MDW8464685.1 hypothetical protein [Chloroherpetonaceae bacterium]
MIAKLAKHSVWLLALSAAVLSSCQQSSGPSEPEGIFPTRIGVTWTYSTSVDTVGNNVYRPAGTTVQRLTGTQQLAGREAFVVISTTTPLTGTPTTDTTLYAYENNRRDQLIYLSGIQDLIDIGGIRNVTGFQPGWYPFIKTSGGIGSTYTILQNARVEAVIDGLGNATITANVQGRVDSTQQLTLNNRTYNTTRITITTNVELRFSPAGFPVTIPISVPLRVWVAPNTGVVRQESGAVRIALAGVTLPGVRQELQSITGN